MIVADTCLVVHLFNETDLTNAVQKVLEKEPAWILPRLWREEYANVLSKLARIEKRSFNAVMRHFSDTMEELKNCERDIDVKKALKLSIESRISVYDAHFVSLAVDYQTLLVTEDKEVLKNCPETSVSIKEFLKL